MWGGGSNIEMREAIAALLALYARYSLLCVIYIEIILKIDIESLGQVHNFFLNFVAT